MVDRNYTKTLLEAFNWLTLAPDLSMGTRSKQLSVLYPWTVQVSVQESRNQQWPFTAIFQRKYFNTRLYHLLCLNPTLHNTTKYIVAWACPGLPSGCYIIACTLTRVTSSQNCTIIVLYDLSPDSALHTTNDIHCYVNDGFYDDQYALLKVKAGAAGPFHRMLPKYILQSLSLGRRHCKRTYLHPIHPINENFHQSQSSPLSHIHGCNAGINGW